MNIFRAMAEENSMPKLGSSSQTLGVRQGIDIEVDSNGVVHPPAFVTGGKNGLSCSPEISLLPDFILPVKFGGTNRKTEVWQIGEQDLGPDLIVQQDAPDHISRPLQKYEIRRLRGCDRGNSPALDEDMKPKTVSMDLDAEIRDVLTRKPDHRALLEIMRRFKEAGGSQREAYETLQRIWEEHGFQDDEHDNPNLLRDELEYTMEVVWGFCSSGQMIWDSSLTNNYQPSNSQTLN
jgi:hypothetical protein